MSTLTTITQSLQMSIVVLCIFLSGLSFCLSTWVIPLTLQLPPKLAVQQFQRTFIQGGKYLLPTSRTLGAALFLNALLTSQLPDSELAEKWKVWAALCGFLLTVVPYEILTIFPLNDRADEIVKELEKGMQKEEDVKRELQGLMRKWQTRNFGRVGLPLITGVIGLLNIVGKDT